MTPGELTNEAAALRVTAEKMIGIGKDGPVAKVSVGVTNALVQAAKEMKKENPLIAAIDPGPTLMWSEVLTIACIIQSS